MILTLKRCPFSVTVLQGGRCLSAIGEAQISPTEVHRRNSQESSFPHKSSYWSTEPSSRYHVTSKWSNVKLKSVNIYQEPTKALCKPVCCTFKEYYDKRCSQNTGLIGWRVSSNLMAWKEMSSILVCP